MILKPLLTFGLYIYPVAKVNIRPFEKHKNNLNCSWLLLLVMERAKSYFSIRVAPFVFEQKTRLSVLLQKNIIDVEKKSFIENH